MNDTTETTVALVACSGILGGLIRGCVGGRADMTVVDMPVVDEATAGDPGDLAHRLRRLAPDVVVWQFDSDALLEQRPEFFGVTGGFPIIAIIDDGRGSALWRLLPQRTTLDAPSFDTLVDTIHAVTAPSEENRSCQ
ncbi:hypothetical protein [Nocardia panacis]|nr:hypothetical protein [Nocardia panacis]